MKWYVDGKLFSTKYSGERSSVCTSAERFSSPTQQHSLVPCFCPVPAHCLRCCMALLSLQPFHASMQHVLPVCAGNGTRNGWFSLGASPAGDPATAAPLPGDGPFDQVWAIDRWSVDQDAELHSWTALLPPSLVLTKVHPCSLRNCDPCRSFISSSTWPWAARARSLRPITTTGRP